MSDVASHGASAVHEVYSRSADSCETESGTARTFSFFGQRRRSGVTQGWAGVTLLAVGAFLFSQIGTTHLLAVQLAILGSVCIVGGLGFAILSIRDLFGRLVIDESGIAVRPGIIGETIRWNELAGWEVKPDSSRYPEACTVLIWTQEDPCALFVPNNWLTGQDRLELRRMLQTYAPEKERRGH